jgi:predicted HNH restriction endonuclease
MVIRGIWAAKHYMIYWKISADERLDLANHRRADYAAHNQLNKVQPGDVLWIVNVYRNHLFLIGRIHVELVVDDTQLAQELVDPDYDEWQEADWYAIANRYNVEPMREVNITPYISQLRFNSESDHLDTTSGAIDVKQLLAVRELMPNSAQFLQQLWYDDEYRPDSVQDYLELLEDDAAYAEGKTIVRTVRQRQRNRQLVEDAKLRFKAKHGHLFCEACGFDFGDYYGVEYIEAHHSEQLASYGDDDSTSLDDLVMLCANCHRMIHTRTPPYSVEELKLLIRQKRGIV